MRPTRPVLESVHSYIAETSHVVESINAYLTDVTSIVEKLPADKLAQVIYRLENARWRREAIYTCGNGGSAATSIHFASDLAKGASAPNKPPMKSRSLCENISLVTAWSNDVSYEEVFTQCMSTWIRSGDVLVAISGSGNSRNVLKAVEMAQSIGATTIGFTGFDGGQMKNLVDICITVPCFSMEQVEDIHLLLCHLITTCLRTINLEFAD